LCISHAQPACACVCSCSSLHKPQLVRSSAAGQTRMSMTFSKKKKCRPACYCPLYRATSNTFWLTPACRQNRRTARERSHIPSVCLLLFLRHVRGGRSIPGPIAARAGGTGSRSTPPVTMMCPVADDPRTQRNGVWCRPPLVRSRSAPGQAGATTSLRLALSRFTAGVYIALLHADRRKNRTSYSDATREGGVVEIRDNRTVVKPVPMLKKNSRFTEN
jgi:hypothetical protein